MKGHHNGSILRPVLANIYMHYVIALWFEKKIKPNIKGEGYVTIYADDTVFCFQYKDEAEMFMKELLPKRLGEFRIRTCKRRDEANIIWKICKRKSKRRKSRNV